MSSSWLWGPVLGQMAIIFLSSSVPDLQAPPVAFSDKIAHALVFGVLAALMLRALGRARWNQVTGWPVMLAVLFTTLYGVTDEWHQHFVRGRTSSAVDVVADAVGAVITAGGVWTWSIIQRIRAEKPSSP